MHADIRGMSPRPQGKARWLGPLFVFLVGSALVVALGAFQLSSKLPELPRGPRGAHHDNTALYVEVFGGLWLALAVVTTVMAAWFAWWNARASAGSRELLQTSGELEQSLLDTIETLNAAVEARDPYTAGHSQRVRRVSLAIGRALALSVDRLGTLGTAAVFHDIGKIGMPDSILTKTNQLTRDESALMHEHVTRGADIVGKFTPFRDSVPAIRHHHERWDGLGYPDGLSGDDIPLEAAIIGLADAWDAMTTDRPYAVALSLNEAMAQIRAGRGKQFNPAVVDAFWDVAKRRPAEVLPPDTPTGARAVV
jgi:HD-GYP domain-containing protein (c-di-GMP phosphodiesterase class II)